MNYVIPKEANIILSNLHKMGLNSAIIAGGYIRDSILSKPTKDIDVFILHSEFKQLIARKGLSTADTFAGQTILADAGFIVNDSSALDECDTSNVDGEETIRFVAGGYFINGSTSANVEHAFLTDCGIQVDLIFVDIDPKDHVLERFDIGLCCVHYDGKQLTMPNRFLTDLNDKTITIKDDLDDRIKSRALHNHVPRVLQKYPDCTLISNFEDIDYEFA